MIKAICFDLDGVYFTGKGKKAFHKNLFDLVRDEDKVGYVLYKSSEMKQFTTGKMSQEEFWNFVRRYLNLKLTDEEFNSLWVKEYEIDKRVRDTVLRVKANGYTTCICSNNNPARVNALENKFHFLSDFNVIVFSYKTGYVKPEKEIYKELVRDCNCQPNELVYSDDNPDKLIGAKQLGINTYIYDNFNGFTSYLKDLGVKV